MEPSAEKKLEHDSALLQALLTHLDELRAMSSRDPAFFMFDSYRYRFTNTAELDDFVAELKSRLSAE